MKARLSRIVAAASALALGATLAACGGSDDKVDAAEISGTSYDGPAVELSFWNGFTGADGAYFDSMVEKFNKDNPNITVKTTTMEWADFYTKLPIAVKSNSGPDVAVMHMDQVSTQAAQGALTPLDGVATDLGLKEADFAEAVWAGGLYQEARYGIPLDVHMHALYYNKGVLEAAGIDPETPPTTGAELEANLETLKEQGVQGMWIDSSGWMRTWFVALNAQFGGQLFSDDGGTVTWNDEAGVEALTWMSDLITKGYSPANVGQDGYWKAFTTDQNAYVIGGIWEQSNPAFDAIEWGVAPLPAIGDSAVTWGSSHQFTATTQVEKDANKLAAAAYFVNSMSSDSIEWAKANQVPARASVRASAEFKALPGMDVFGPLIDQTVLPQNFPGLPESQGKLEEAINSVLLGESTPKDALDKSAKDAQLIVTENKSKFGY
jgi:multiple sugar transport system substrate-binding protein